MAKGKERRCDILELLSKKVSSIFHWKIRIFMIAMWFELKKSEEKSMKQEGKMAWLGARIL